MLYYVTDFAGFMAEHQFVAFMLILQPTFQNWNNRIHDVSENDDEINNPLYTDLMNGHKSVCFKVSIFSVN
jgi:hypothetical protein